MCKLKISWWLAFIILLVIGCDKSEDPSAESLFTMYINRFVEEGKLRNINVDASNLSVTLVDPSEIPPYCGYGDRNPPRVRIANSDQCWTKTTDVQKEILLFHEMGHALLGRSHVNSALPNCEFKSIMNEGTLFNLYDEKATDKRKYYLDELFNPNTTVPYWAGIKTKGPEIFYDSITASADGWTFHAVSGATHTGAITKDGNSKSHSLSISGTTSATESNALGFWKYQLKPDAAVSKSSFELSVKIKCTALTGRGAYFILQSDAIKYPFYYSSSNEITSIKGTTDFTEYKIMLNCYPDEKPDLFIYLMVYGASTGTVYFDDIKITYYY